MFDEQTPVVSDLDRQQALDKALASFGDNKPLTGVVAKSIRGIPGAGYTDLPEVVDEELAGDELEADQRYKQDDLTNEEDTEPTEEAEETTEESEVNEGFATDFKKVFGLEPAEAVETFNQLLNFRNEVLLMQEWNVSPGEYRQRMSQVKEFYEGLPEDGREQFNTPEGAIAIWNHLANSSGQQKKTAAVKATRKTAKAPAKASYLFTKEQILRMSPDEFRQNAPAIQQAYLNGRVRD